MAPRCAPRAGWGLIDRSGLPKLAYHHVKRALSPVAVWTVDEGLGGVVAHVANDKALPLLASLRVTLYRDLELRVGEATIAIELEPHSQREWNIETLIGRFVDAAWAYRFGPPAQDAIVVTLERSDVPADGSEMLSQAVSFSGGAAPRAPIPRGVGAHRRNDATRRRRVPAAAAQPATRLRRARCDARISAER